MRLIIISILLCGLTFVSCEHRDESQSVKNLFRRKVKPIDRDLNDIRNRGYIVAVVDNNPTGMFLYRGEPLGFEYELISNYAKHVGLDLKFQITHNIEEGINMINKGKGDILAHNLTITKERREQIGFTDAHYHIKQVLIQRKPRGWRDMKLHEIDESLIRNVIDLINKDVHVRKHSSHVSRLKNLSDEIGGEITIVEDFEHMETEAVIEMVAKGEIDYTVADENIAMLMAKRYPILDVNTPISFPQQIAWGVRDNADSLKISINKWLRNIKKGSVYNDLYNKYYKNSRRTRDLLRSDFFSVSGDKISPYDSIIKVAADSLRWDWKLLAALISRESRFDAEAESWVGAIGLMQILPKTAAAYGITNLGDPAMNIMAGMNHLLWLKDRWKHIPDSSEQIRFVLASYNVGHGHVRDAVKLASKHGSDPLVWKDNVEKFMLLKSNPKYYEDPVVSFGYCRGNEPVQYVNDILTRFDHYQQLGSVQDSIN